MRIAVSGTFSLGLSTNVFPHTSATGYIHSGTIAGKLNGVMPTHTPSGRRIDSQSMPRAMLGRISPIKSEGIPHANSTISIPRRMLPRASISVLPCSRETRAASSSKASSSSILKRKNTRARSVGGVSAHAGNAAAAASTASSTTLASHIGVSAITSPREGLKTGVVSTPETVRHWPAMKLGTEEREARGVIALRFMLPDEREMRAVGSAKR